MPGKKPAMEPYRKLRVERPAKAVKPISAEERYWNSFTVSEPKSTHRTTHEKFEHHQHTVSVDTIESF